ncbi:MAG: bifunctional N(6)-L-threonylcarbamoyladenine synthase/serine/threonine protein kinase [Euryarchaeota archaeon]|nr:bifunctional N(6)-L-threonylcarbamoyladenine synthase/serine/threonine protein kinase [Euryarchaeota archaeon]
MRVLGLEGTAHTCGAGVVEADPDDPGRCLVLSNRADMHRPESGGIHPREAAEHHVRALPLVVRAALEDAALAPRELDGIAFSQGPGLGPCLRTVATVARALALRYELPLVGVNHCVAHIEIGRGTTACEDPVMLYASGGNTQVIAEARGRYRVFGETLDIGIGNALDKFARGLGLPFPGGPRIEELAREGAAMLAASGAPLPELPYSVKGMDLAFSGLMTAAEVLVRGGTPVPVVCHAFQEWAYAMLVEVTERAVAHAGKDEVLLGGGVGRNLRLQEMLRTMAEERGARFFVPEGPLLSDNGAMIGWNGLLALASGHPTPLADSKVSQTYRTDAVDLVWRAETEGVVSAVPGGGDHMATGAEAVVDRGRFLGRDVVLKRRVAKGYRHPEIERRLVEMRVRHETRLLVAAREAGVSVPAVLDVDPEAGVLVLEEIVGPSVKAHLLSGRDGAGALFSDVGRRVARLHDAGIVHGDLTTSNLMLDPSGGVVFIDFGLAARTDEDEARAVDLHVLQEALLSTHRDSEPLWADFLSAYREAEPAHVDEVLRRYDELVQRGRYRSMLG